MAKRLKELTERTKIEIVPTPGQDKGQNVSYKNPGQQAEKDFVGKHVIQKTDYPVTQKSGSNDDIFSGAKQNKKKRIADQDNEKESSMYEASQEDIVKGMKKYKSDFVKRYGKDADSVMYATANKLADEDVDVEEEYELDSYVFQLGDGHEIELDEESMDIIAELFDDLNEDQQEQFIALFDENLQTNTNLLDWIRSVQ